MVLFNNKSQKYPPSDKVELNGIRGLTVMHSGVQY